MVGEHEGGDQGVYHRLPVFHEIVINHPFGALGPELHILQAVEKDRDDVGISSLDLLIRLSTNLRLSACKAVVKPDQLWAAFFVVLRKYSSSVAM